MESLVFLLIMFLIGGVLQSLGQKSRERQRRGRLPTPDPSDDDERGESPKSILEAIREAMEAAERERQSGVPRPMPVPRRAPTSPTRPLPSEPAETDLFEEEAESLEEEPEIRSLEIEAPRTERVPISRDDEIEAVVQRRRQWAEQQARPMTPADHQAFDQKIRKPALPERVDPRDIRSTDIRQMILWHEILGKPKSLRD
ncbi:MAG: hypothetical protein FJ206_03000 [Gemmatimonadetes bacterium]|nr:hypothetical protein [Gemmatimonadota bacterium]